MTIGDVARINADKARREAERIYSEAKLGHDPAKRKELEAALAEANIVVGHRTVPRKQEGDAARQLLFELDRYLHQHWEPLHRRPITKIEIEEIDKRLKRTVEAHGKVSAARGRIVLSSLFVFAMRKGWCGANPVVATDDPAAGTKARELNE